MKIFTIKFVNNLAVAVRAYDPCLSCATHTIGQMPLVMELVEEEKGAVLDCLVRDADGTVRHTTFPLSLEQGYLCNRIANSWSWP